MGKPKAAKKPAKAAAEVTNKAQAAPEKVTPKATPPKADAASDADKASASKASGEAPPKPGADSKSTTEAAVEPAAADKSADEAPPKTETKEPERAREEPPPPSKEVDEKEASDSSANDDDANETASTRVTGGLSATASPEIDQPSASESDPAERQNTAIEARLQGGMFARSFSYTDNETENRNFDANGPTVGVRALVYPAAFALDGVPALFGLSLGYSREFPPETSDASGVGLTSASQEWYAGLRARVPVLAHELGLELRYVHQSYELSGDENAGPCAWNSIAGDRALASGVSCLFPDVAYGALEPLLEARANFGRFFVAASAGVRIVLESGELRSPYWFPDAEGAALEFGVRTGFRVAQNLDAVIGGDVRQYGFDFNPLPSARLSASAPGPVAGGAIDRYFSAWLGLTYSLPGRS